mmetsp:Transcript_1647/g.4332  ORF Transcript_1647/g.4332 Transcript_1647/m.4332 type:complete len:230 (+) Transcript_1647:940-1629(+)
MEVPPMRTRQNQTSKRSFRSRTPATPHREYCSARNRTIQRRIRNPENCDLFFGFTRTMFRVWKKCRPKVATNHRKSTGYAYGSNWRIGAFPLLCPLPLPTFTGIERTLSKRSRKRSRKRPGKRNQKKNPSRPCRWTIGSEKRSQTNKYNPLWIISRPWNNTAKICNEKTTIYCRQTSRRHRKSQNQNPRRPNAKNLPRPRCTTSGEISTSMVASTRSRRLPSNPPWVIP